MKPDKSIERLFQESLKDLQATPSSKVWDGIEKKMSAKNTSRTSLALWPQVASMVAILVLFLAIGALYYSPLENKNSVAESSSSSLKSEPASIEIVTSNYSASKVNQALFEIEQSFQEKLAFQINQTEISKDVNDGASTFTTPNQEAKTSQEGIAIVNQLNASPIKSNSSLIITSSSLHPKTKPSDKKKSIFDEIENENLVAEEETSTLSKSWAVQPTVAPVFMNSLSGGNPLEPSLQGRTTSNPNMSYGVNVAYTINKNIKIRTGVNQVAMGYNTQNVVMSVSTSALRGQNTELPNANAYQMSNITLSNPTSSNRINSQPELSTFGSRPTRVETPVGSLNHELGFVEVPIEIEYALIDRKLGVHLLGGASTFLLSNNEVFFEGSGQSSSLGEADNLNSFSFSANFGVGMDYNFSKRISLNLEPKFMYQINTFRNNTDSFQPYFFGIYSGIKFKF
jgi:hypothetical protein